MVVLSRSERITVLTVSEGGRSVNSCSICFVRLFFLLPPLRIKKSDSIPKNDATMITPLASGVQTQKTQSYAP
jgi:hypothetical protein